MKQKDKERNYFILGDSKDKGVGSYKSHIERLIKDLVEVIKVIDNPKNNPEAKLQVKLTQIGHFSFLWYEEARNFAIKRLPNEVSINYSLPFLPKGVESFSGQELENLIGDLSTNYSARRLRSRSAPLRVPSSSLRMGTSGTIGS